MDFDGKDKVVEKISQNQTLYTQLMAAQAQMAQMAAVIDGLTGGSTNLTGNMAARTEATANQDSPQQGRGENDHDRRGGRHPGGRQPGRAGAPPRAERG